MNQNWPHDTVVVSGPDALSYLHSQLSQQLVSLEVGASTWSFVLEPAGRVDALVQVTRTAPEVVELRVDRGWGAALVDRLNRFRIRVRAEVALGAGEDGDPVRYHDERVRAAWPAMGAEITEQTIPAEMPNVVAVAVSFSKGCYPGQELVERMDARAAQAPRRLAQLRLPAGTPVDEASVTITSRTRDGDSDLVLALVRRGVDVPYETALTAPVGA